MTAGERRKSPPEVLQDARSGLVLDDPRHQKERTVDQNDMHQEKDRAGQAGAGKQAEAEQEDADMADHLVGEQVAQIFLADGADGPGQHGEGGEDEKQHLPVAVRQVKQGEETHQGIDADFGQQGGEQRRRRRRGGGIGGRQPGEEGEQGRLDAESGEKQAGGERQGKVGIFAGKARQVGEIKRPRHPVEQADRGQQQGRGEQVEQQVFQRSRQLGRSGRRLRAGRRRRSG